MPVSASEVWLQLLARAPGPIQVPGLSVLRPGAVTRPPVRAGAVELAVIVFFCA